MIFIDQHILEQIVQRVRAGDKLLHAEALVGGVSAQVALLEVQHADGGTRKYLLRVHGERDRARNSDIAQHEFSLLKILHTAGLPVPQPHYLDISGEVYPIPYLMLDYLNGATNFSPKNLTDFLQQSVELLAKIHQLKQNLAVEDSSTLDFLPDRVAHVLSQIGQIEQIDYQTELLDALGLGKLRDTLRTLFPLKQVNTPTLLHGDFWAGNLIWQEEKLVGIIDWENAELGDPLSDLSITRLDMLWAFGKDAMYDFTQAYQTLMPHLDYGNLPAWDLFAAIRPGNQLGEWAATWAGYGRSDVTLTTMRESQLWFVKQAVEQLTR
ncbi:MAG: phosphotransferase [Chloroflexota bacterium]